ncbi:MAG: DUF423 domain-containing protein [Gammaproteobacteria bacterium]
MSVEGRIFLFAGSLALLTATIFGAYGTHGIRGTVDPTEWEAYNIAVDYQFFHGLGLIGIALLTGRDLSSRLICPAGWLLLAGILLFSGSIYATTFGAPKALGQSAPLGGLCFMLGWLSVALAALKRNIFARLEPD